jgi:ABC-type transporter Mla subunit MlaD
LEDKLAKTVDDLSNAIDKLENAATKAAGVLADGGEAASKLMKASNIGLDQVFDFIRNLEKLVEEVIDAAS